MQCDDAKRDEKHRDNHSDDGWIELSPKMRAYRSQAANLGHQRRRPRNQDRQDSRNRWAVNVSPIEHRTGNEQRREISDQQPLGPISRQQIDQDADAQPSDCITLNLVDLSRQQQERDKRKEHVHSLSISSQTKTINNNKLYLYLFHLFESVINNVSQLVAKTMQTTLRDVGDLGMVDEPPKANEKETINTINTIATGSEAMPNEENKNGFFSENLKSILKSKQRIEKAIDKISGQLLVVNQNGKK